MDLWDVVITGFRLNATEKPATALQRILCLGPGEAGALAKGFPCVVRAALPAAEAQHLQSVLREAGAHVQLREPGRSMPPETGMPASVLPSGLPLPASPGSAPAPAPRDAAATPSQPAAAPSRPAAAPSRETPVTTHCPEDAAFHGDDVAPRASLTAAMPPPAPGALELSNAPLLFRATLTALTEAPPPPVLLPYQLGELVVVPTNSRPAPEIGAPLGEPVAEPVRIQGQPVAAATGLPAATPVAGRSQPAPASVAGRSQPAPTGTAVRSQPAPEVEAGAMQMFEDPFGSPDGPGPALDIDESALSDRSARVQSSFRPNAHVVATGTGRRGLIATLLWPVALIWHYAVPALALTGVAAIAGAAVYLIKDKARNDTGLTPTDEAPALDATERPSEPEEATHPLLRVTPRAMEPSVASILRVRMAGVHKVLVTWPADQRPEGVTECMLVEEGQAAQLKELASTGRHLDPPADVVEQLAQHMEALQAAQNRPGVTFTPVCLAN